MKLDLCCLVLALMLGAAGAKGTFHGNPRRYNLFRTGGQPHYNPVKPTSRHKNHCAYVVQKNVSCTVQDGMSTYVKGDYTTKCSWGQKCPVLMYRTFYKPTYKVGYKTVTELEWRCCPGYSGENCSGGPTPGPGEVMPPALGPRPGLRGLPWGRPEMPSVDPDPRPGGRPENTPSGQLPPGGPRPGVSGERLDRMEDDLRKLSRGLETLSGLVSGLEERLRASLREDAGRMLSTALGDAPHRPGPGVETGVVPGAPPPVLGELMGRVTEVRDELRVKSETLDGLRGTVMGHGGQLKGLREQRIMGELLDARLDGFRGEILDGFERRLSGLEERCSEKVRQVQRQCHAEHLMGQEQLQLSLDGRETGLRRELGDLRAQVQGLAVSPGCCAGTGDISQRTLLLEDSVRGLTESQRQLQVALREQTLHIEATLDSRLLDAESRLNATGQGGSDALLEERLRDLEGRLFVAVEELSNATAPVLLGGQAVPALGAEMENLGRHVQGELDGVRRQLSELELLCAPPCPDTPLPRAELEERRARDKEISDRLDSHSDVLGRLNVTLRGLLARLAQGDHTGSVRGEVTILRVNFSSVDREVRGLRDAVHLLAEELGHADSAAQERQRRLSSRVQGVAEAVGQQGALLGAGERRLLQLQSELQGAKRRLSGELQGCRGAARDTRREVEGVEGRLAQVEGDLARRLEGIRAELEGRSGGYLAQVNGTLASHTQQLEQLRDDLQECVNMDK